MFYPRNIKNIKRTLLISMLFGLLLICNIQLEGQINTTRLSPIQKLAAIPIWQGNGIKNLPPKLDLKPFAPPIGNQGKANTCVGWAVGYGAMTIQEIQRKRLTGQEKIRQNIYSPIFIYQQIPKKECYSAVNLIDAIKVVQKKGNLLISEFSTLKMNCNYQFNSTQLTKAKKGKIKAYTLLFKRKSNAERKINNTKEALAAGYPVVLSLSTRKNFHQLRNTKFWLPKLGNTTYANGHALVVIGYDDKKDAFQLMNSWGTKWGDNGFIWIKYKDFVKYAQHAFCLVNLDELKKPSSNKLNKPKKKYPIQLMATKNYNPKDKRLQNLKHLGVISTQAVKSKDRLLTRVILTGSFKKEEVRDILNKIQKCCFYDAFLLSPVYNKNHTIDMKYRPIDMKYHK